MGWDRGLGTGWGLGQGTHLDGFGVAQGTGDRVGFRVTLGTGCGLGSSFFISSVK